MVAPDSNSGCFSTTSLSTRPTRRVRSEEGRGSGFKSHERAPPNPPHSTAMAELGTLAVNYGERERERVREREGGRAKQLISIK